VKAFSIVHANTRNARIIGIENILKTTVLETRSQLFNTPDLLPFEVTIVLFKVPAFRFRKYLSSNMDMKLGKQVSLRGKQNNNFYKSIHFSFIFEEFLKTVHLQSKRMSTNILSTPLSQ